MSKLQTKNSIKKRDCSDVIAEKENEKMQFIVCKYCNTELVKGVAILNDIRNYGMTGLFEQTDKTGLAYTVRSSGSLYQVLKCPECGYSVSNDIQRNVKEGAEPNNSAALTQATTGAELLEFLQSSPLQGVELDLDNRDKSTGRVATFDD